MATPDPDTIYIVTGPMRTGTSLMMQLLKAAGIEPVYSEQREEALVECPVTNPVYYEHNEYLGGHIRYGLYELRGHAVKVMIHGMRRVPCGERYKVICTQRGSQGRIASLRSGNVKRQKKDKKLWDRMERQKAGMLPAAYQYVSEHFDVLHVDYDTMFDQTDMVLDGLEEHLGIGELPKAEMAAVIDPGLRHFMADGSPA